MGAWIETNTGYPVCVYAVGRTLMGAWIETNISPGV